MFAHRIANQFIALSVLGTVLVASLIGMSAIVYSSRTLQKEAESRMLVQASDTARQLNTENARVETAVQEIGFLVANSFDLEKFKQDPGYLKKYNQKVGGIFKMTGENIDGPMDVYFLFDPNLINQMYIITFYDKNNDGHFVQTAPDHIDRQFFELAGPTWQWFYQP